MEKQNPVKPQFQLVLMLPFSGVHGAFWFPPALPPLATLHPPSSPIFPAPPHPMMDGAFREPAGGLGSGGNEEDKICEPSRRDTVISASLAALRVMDGRSTPTQGARYAVGPRVPAPAAPEPRPLTTEPARRKSAHTARARGGAQTHTHIRTLSLYGAPPRSTAPRPHTRQTNSPSHTLLAPYTSGRAPGTYGTVPLPLTHSQQTLPWHTHKQECP